ncbi:HAD family hydrolase [Pseudomonas azerbaijanoccidentalis]
MTFNGGIAEAAAAFEITLSPQKLMELQSALEIELKSIQHFDDALPAFDMIRNRGMKVGGCSNLSQPYCATVRELLQRLNGYAVSPEVGVMKPDPLMYQSACHLLGLEPGSAPEGGSRVLMIGESPKCDRDGPRQIEIVSYHLNRIGKGRFGDLLAFAHALTASD